MKLGLPQFSYILRKSEPLGIEFKNMACNFTGVLIFLDVHIGKQGEKPTKYHRECGSTKAYTKRMVEAMKRLVQRK